MQAEWRISNTGAGVVSGACFGGYMPLSGAGSAPIGLTAPLAWLAESGKAKDPSTGAIIGS